MFANPLVRAMLVTIGTNAVCDSTRVGVARAILHCIEPAEDATPFAALVLAQCQCSFVNADVHAVLLCMAGSVGYGNASVVVTQAMCAAASDRNKLPLQATDDVCATLFALVHRVAVNTQSYIDDVWTHTYIARALRTVIGRGVAIGAAGDVPWVAMVRAMADAGPEWARAGILRELE